MKSRSHEERAWNSPLAIILAPLAVVMIVGAGIAILWERLTEGSDPHKTPTSKSK